MDRTSAEIEYRLWYVFAASLQNARKLAWNRVNETDFELSVLASERANPILFVEGYKGSALVYLNGRPFYALDGYHSYLPLEEGQNQIRVSFSPYLAFGERTDIAPGVPYYVEVRNEPLRLYELLHGAFDLANATSDDGLRQDLRGALTEALQVAYFTACTQEQMRLANSMGVSRFSLEPPIGLGKNEGYYVEQDLSRFQKALELFERRLANLRNRYGKHGTVMALAHAHIDAAWLWPFEETRNKVARTFSTVDTLMKRYDFVYVQSTAMYYEWLKQDFPELFNRISDRVRSGKWILTAGWVESDTNMLPGECLARQFLLSQEFYLREFGKIAEIYWLPDTFGFAASIPQVAKLAGVKMFATHKVFWNDTNKFPYSYFRWTGIDGTSLRAFAFGNGKGGYNSTMAVSELLEQWNNGNRRDPIIYTYGYGDGGGGPTSEMLRRIDAFNDLPLLPVLHKGILQLQEPKAEWRGELYLETHRGTLTSHSKMKSLHARVAAELIEAEMWSVLAGLKPSLEELWKVLLKDEFHDVLPGSAINEVYQQVYEELESVARDAGRIKAEALGKIGGQGNSLLVFNPLPWERREFVEVPEQLQQSQKVGQNYVVQVRAPPLGVATLSPLPLSDRVIVRRTAHKIYLQNKFIRLSIDSSTGEISVHDREAGRNPVTRGNRFVFYENIPGWADAWDIERSYSVTSFAAKLESLEEVQGGPLVAEVRMRFAFRNSFIEETLRLYSGSRKIELEVTPSLHDRELLLKLWFDTDVNAGRATSDVPFGSVERQTTRNTSWDAARFEVPMLTWTDLSESGYGIALLSFAKHGISAEGGSFGLSLSKTSVYPDPAADGEVVKAKIIIYPHVGDWTAANVPRVSYEFLHPLTVKTGVSQSRSFVAVKEPNLMLESIKWAEDGSGPVLRLYESHNRRGKGTVKVWFDPVSCEATDLLEKPLPWKSVKARRSTLRFNYSNYEIVTLKLRQSALIMANQ